MGLDGVQEESATTLYHVSCLGLLGSGALGFDPVVSFALV